MDRKRIAAAALVLAMVVLGGCIVGPSSPLPGEVGPSSPTPKMYAAELAGRETAEAQETRSALDSSAQKTADTQAAQEREQAQAAQKTADAQAAQEREQAQAAQKTADAQAAQAADIENTRRENEVGGTATADALALQGQFVSATATADAVQRQQAAADFLYPLQAAGLTLLAALALSALLWLAVRLIKALIRWIEIRGRTVSQTATKNPVWYIPDDGRLALPGRTPSPVLDLREGAGGFTVAESATAVMRDQTALLVLASQAGQVARAGSHSPVVLGQVAPGIVAPVTPAVGALPQAPGLVAIQAMPIHQAAARGVINPALAASIEEGWAGEAEADPEGEV